MTRNTFTDGQPFSVVALNSQKHAHNDEGVISGGDLSLGTGAFEVDITSTEYAINGSTYSLGAGTVDHVDSDTDDRIDLVTATDAGSYNVVSGNPASEAGKPNAPDIPAGEVLLGAVYVVGGSSELASADLYGEYKTPIGLKKVDFVQSTQPAVSEGSTWYDTDSGYLRVGHNDSWNDPVGQGQGSGLNADVLRNNTPSDLVTLSNSNVPAHGINGNMIYKNSSLNSISGTGTFNSRQTIASGSVDVSGYQAVEIRADFYWSNYSWSGSGSKGIEGWIVLDGNDIANRYDETSNSSGSFTITVEQDIASKTSINLDFDMYAYNSDTTVDGEINTGDTYPNENVEDYIT